MWLRSADEMLINLAQVEAIELIDVFPEDADPDAVDAGAVSAVAFDLVALLPSGWEAVLFSSEYQERTRAASDFLAGLLAAEGVGATLGRGRVRTLEELMERGGGGGSGSN